MLSILIGICVSATPILIVSGQSLSAGGATGSATSTTQPYNNTMVSGLLYDSAGTGSPTYLVYTPTYAAWPWTALVEASLESPRSGAANYYRSVTGVDLHVVSGSRGGSVYTGLKKGTGAWDQMARSLEAAGARGEAACVALYVEHGESDGQVGTARATLTATGTGTDVIAYICL